MTQNEHNLRKFLETLKPKENVPFNLIVNVLSGKKVIPIDNSKKDNELLKLLKKAVIKAGKETYNQGIFTKRPNEAGNKIEHFLITALNEIGLLAEIPRNASGKKQSAGYPDIYLKDSFGRHNYVEVKTHEYNVDVTKKGLRAFYMSPPKPNKSKIIYDARHFIVAYGLEKIQRNGKTCFIPKNWKLISIHNMKVNIKYEFNTDSPGMYNNSIIDKGKI